jgi:hypothetical protein
MALMLPPERYEPLEVQLPDNSVKPAVWTGAQWWCDGQQIIPQAWRPVRSSFDLENALQSA